MNRLLSFCVVSLLACLVLTITQSSVTAQDQLENFAEIPELFGGDIRSLCRQPLREEAPG